MFLETALMLSAFGIIPKLAPLFMNSTPWTFALGWKKNYSLNSSCNNSIPWKMFFSLKFGGFGCIKIMWCSRAPLLTVICIGKYKLKLLLMNSCFVLLDLFWLRGGNISKFGGINANLAGWSLARMALRWAIREWLVEGA